MYIFLLITHISMHILCKIYICTVDSSLCFVPIPWYYKFTIALWVSIHHHLIIWCTTSSLLYPWTLLVDFLSFEPQGKFGQEFRFVFSVESGRRALEIRLFDYLLGWVRRSQTEYYLKTLLSLAIPRGKLAY